MSEITIKKAGPLRGEITVPGDKSISHRAVMFGALAEGTTRITHFLQGADCLSTIGAFRRMGIEIENNPEEILVHGQGLHGLHASSAVLNMGNSGTTTRLISGILAGQNFESRLDGDASLRKRPMRRIMRPLTMMGAAISADMDNDCLPLTIRGQRLHAVHYASPVASAQVKSCVLLAGMYADGITSVTEPVLSRNHTELMLRHFGAAVKSEGTTVSIEPEPHLFAQNINVPGDISSAAYFIAAALLVPGSEILLKNVGINETRAGMLRVCRNMGADIQIVRRLPGAEPAADLLVRYSHLKGTIISGDLIPALIDEIPVLAVLAAYAEGMTVIKDAAELKVKESDRIAVVTENLRRMGADIIPAEDGMIINSGNTCAGTEGHLTGAFAEPVDPHMDHRIAMGFAVAALAADGPTKIRDADCVRISYPAFYEDLKRLQK